MPPIVRAADRGATAARPAYGAPGECTQAHERTAVMAKRDMAREKAEKATKDKGKVKMAAMRGDMKRKGEKKDKRK